MNRTPHLPTLLVLAITAGWVGAAQAQETGAGYTVPPRPPLEHYLDALQPSPFTLKVVDQPANKAAPSFAANLVLKGFHTIGGEQTVAYSNLKTGQSAYLKGDDADGVRLVKLNVDRDRSKTEALIAKGAETAVIRTAPTAPTQQALGNPTPPAPTKLAPGQEAAPPQPTTPVRRRRVILPGQTNAG